MALTILSVAYPLAPVGPDAVGGAEQILASLDSALVERGHRSLVIAVEGSVCRGELLAVAREDGPLDDAARRRARERTRAAIERALHDYQVDLVHLHGIDFSEYLPTTSVPLLATLHLPPSWYPPEIFSRPRALMSCVSASQLAGCPPSSAVLGFVANGIDLSQFRPGEPGSDAVALGRICPEKGFHLAARAARRAGVPLAIAGQVFAYEAHARYFREELEPELDAERRFIGPVGRHGKQSLLSRARCLLAPSLAPETSSLVAMEALASGTPVVAFAQGALPELVSHGRTGFLVADEDEMAEAIRAVDGLDRAECRRFAERRFSAEEMVDGYLGLYATALERAPRRRVRAAPQIVEIARELPTSRDALDEWRALWSDCPDATFFQHPEWVRAWGEAFRPAEIRFATVRSGRRLLAAAPLLVYEHQRERVMTTFGAGLADYGGLLVRAGCAAATSALLFELARERDWDVCRFEQLRPNDPLLRIAAPSGLAEAIEPGVPCPVLTLERGGMLEDAVPRRFAARVHYDQKRLVREGSVRWERATTANARELFDALATLHRARWTEQGEQGVLGERELSFHRRLVERLAGSGLLLLDALRFDGRVVAAIYGFRAHGTSSYYLGGFDPSLRKLSPGVALIGWTIEQELRAGAVAFDFLRGGESYKYAWGASDRPTFRRLLVRTSTQRNSQAALTEGSEGVRSR